MVKLSNPIGVQYRSSQQQETGNLTVNKGVYGTLNY